MDKTTCNIRYCFKVFFKTEVFDDFPTARPYSYTGPNLRELVGGLV